MSIYTEGQYLKENTTWHVEDSPWKAKQIFKMSKNTQLEEISTVAEIGCGAGEILVQLSKMFDTSIEYTEYDISLQVAKF